jgi:DNA primase
LSRLLGQSDVDAVRQATNLVQLIQEHVPLRPKGREHVGLCPFHDDHSPSFCVVTHKGNAFYKCHSCGAGGDVFDFVMNYHKMEFGEALRYLADRAGITLRPRTADPTPTAGSTRTELRKANAFAAMFFQRMLNDAAAGASAREVIQQRQISDDMVRAFMLGAAPDQWDGLVNRVHKQGLPEQLFIAAGLIKQRKNEGGCFDMFRNRLIFPICDELGHPVAFGARKINPEDEPKYLNSAESAVFVKSRTLYGLNLAKRAIIDSRTAIICEGYTDVIACHQAGIANVVGTLGTALTNEHARILSKICDTVVLLFDGDAAGMRAADRGVNVFFHEPVDVKICVLPDELDPDELLKQPGGAERFHAALATATDAIEYKVNRLRTQLDQAKGLSGRQKIIEAFLAELVDLGFASMSGVRKSMVMTRLSGLLGISVPDLERSLPMQRRRENVSATSSGDAPPATEAIIAQPISRARRLAEHELLSVLVYEPTSGWSASFDEHGSRAAGSLTDVIKVDHFIDAAARELAEVLFQAVGERRRLTVQDLLAASTAEATRNLVSRLYFEGERYCAEHGDDAVLALRSAVRSLLACMARELLHAAAAQCSTTRDAAGSLNALEQLIQQRRQAGDLAGAIANGIRN